MNTEKLQKVIASFGIASRRKAEELINQGKVSVNGKIVGIGTRVSANDVIRVDGKIINPNRKSGTQRKTRLLLYHKPEGEITSREGDGKPTVFKSLPRIRDGRWVAVGRLDLNTSGLLLFTNDGGLANHLMHPSRKLQRVYMVRILGELSPDQINRLKQGIDLEDGKAVFTTIHEKPAQGRNRWYEVVLEEGRNREIRRMFEALGYAVSRLIRIAYGPLILPKNLRRGQFTELSRDQLQVFLQQVGYPGEKAARKGKHLPGSATTK